MPIAIVKSLAFDLASHAIANSGKSCSIDCYKQHKSVHAQSQIPPATAPIKAPTPSVISTADSSKQDGHKLQQDSYNTLLQSAGLQQLLTRYPPLKSLLNSIYTTTLEPTPEAQERDARRRERRQRGRGNGRSIRKPREREAPWTQERALRQALNHFRKLKAAEGRDGEGLKEFTALVAKTTQESTAKTPDGQPQEFGEGVPMALA